MNDPDILVVIGRLGLSVLMGAALGWDREMRQKPAGLRTHMLVALGAAGFTLLGLEFVAAGPQTTGAGNVDVLRVIQGIIGGIGFLGAGAIIHGRGEVAGMTTAAGIWVTAAIGIACGLGELVLAGLLTVASVLVLSTALWLERMVERRTGNGPRED
jgi:putative Mg2+ transporter-C (MgtC) family protein